MDPAIVDSATFGQLWKVAFNYQEQVSQPSPFVGSLSKSIAYMHCTHLKSLETSRRFESERLTFVVLCQTPNLYSSRQRHSNSVYGVESELDQNTEC